mgnify:CR=1 FL=1
MYRKIGKITSINEIPYGQNIIISGTIGNGWFLRVPGRFEKRNNKLVYIDVHGCMVEHDMNSYINLSILEKVY